MGDEWQAGRIGTAFEGRGVVRTLEYAPGAVLMERLQPATPLAELVFTGRDDEAIGIAAGVISEMCSVAPQLESVPTVEEWGESFGRYLALGDGQLGRDLVEEAQTRYERLAETQRSRRLVHGDLQHHNIVWDERRGWTAIDPKGVIGEIEYELGAMLRNPEGQPDLYMNPAVVRRRTARFAEALDLDRERVAEWAFAQAVLSAIWTIEDHERLSPENPAISPGERRKAVASVSRTEARTFAKPGSGSRSA